MSSLHALTAELAPFGLNLLGVADPAAWDAAASAQRTTAALLPETRSIVVVGNGGPDMWRAFVRDLEAEPTHFTHEEHPLDAYCRRAVDRADRVLEGRKRRWFWAAAQAELHIDFRVLARLAGLGEASRLGLLLHPTFGPWLGLRAACFVDLELPFATPAPAGDPLSPSCAHCSSCVDACPGSAFASADARGPTWAVDACSTFHHTSTRCASTCHARAACPVGAANRYDADEFAYHSNRPLGRVGLRARLGLAPGADRYAGEGPHWRDWRERVDVKGG